MVNLKVDDETPKETTDFPDFTDSIPVDQDNMGFNDPPKDSVEENDFNFFDNNDLL